MIFTASNTHFRHHTLTLDTNSKSMGNHVSSIAVPLIAAVAAACSPTVGSFFNYVDKVDRGR